MFEDTEQDYVKRLLELVEKSTSVQEHTNVRLTHVESGLDKLNYSINGNGHPGLNEKVRNLENLYDRFLQLENRFEATQKENQLLSEKNSQLIAKAGALIYVGGSLFLAFAGKLIFDLALKYGLI